MRSIEAYEKLNPTWNAGTISGGERPLSYVSTSDVLVSLGKKSNLIGSWIQRFEENYSHKKMMHKEKIGDLFKNIPVTIT